MSLLLISVVAVVAVALVVVVIVAAVAVAVVVIVVVVQSLSSYRRFCHGYCGNFGSLSSSSLLLLLGSVWIRFLIMTTG